MSKIKTLGCLCMLSALMAGTPCSAAVSGQERAQQAGRAILGTAAPRLVLKTIDVGFNDSVDAVQAFRKKLGITMPIVFDDGSLGAAFHLRVTPTHIVIGRDGRVAYVGHLADQALDAALLAARSPAGTGAPGATALRSVALTPGDSAPIKLGDLLPNRSLRSLDGRRFDLHRVGAQDKLTALVFLSPWCESYLATTRPEASANCRNMRTQVDALAADSRIRWLGIAGGLWANSEDLKQYQKDYKVSIPLTLDASGEAFRSFRVNDVPTVILADRGGRIVRRIDGAAAEDPKALRTAIDSL